MMPWLNALTDSTGPAVLVTVAIVEGSGPREPGAKMVVTNDTLFDTIGGGHLELRAVGIARDMLASGAARRLERFPLGPSLGQCCGGVVHLAFERIDAALREHMNRLRQSWRQHEDVWRIVALDHPLPPALADGTGTCIAGPASSLPDVDCKHHCDVITAPDGQRWLVDPCLAWRPRLMLFGAGHVGAAIVRALAALPCHVTWVDEREEAFPASVPDNVTIEATDTPEALIDAAPDGTTFLVMTHSHALDQRLAEAILRRPACGWFGLIGSRTKRRLFEHRLRQRGIPEERLEDMTCPIGLPGIGGKAPAVIAASVCAQLLMVWEAAAYHAAAMRLRTACRAAGEQPKEETLDDA